MLQPLILSLHGRIFQPLVNLMRTRSIMRGKAGLPKSRSGPDQFLAPLPHKCDANRASDRIAALRLGQSRLGQQPAWRLSGQPQRLLKAVMDKPSRHMMACGLARILQSAIPVLPTRWKGGVPPGFRGSWNNCERRGAFASTGDPSRP